jgi:predicted nucleic acid-binding protein
MIVIGDAGPVLHLHWVGVSDWALPPQQVHVVTEVWQEIDKFAPEALKDPRLWQVEQGVSLSSALAPYRLDDGEAASLSYALSIQPTEPVVILCDERVARRACGELSIPCIGSVGLIVAAFRVGRATVEDAVSALEDLPRSGRMYVRPRAIADAVAQVKREAKARP